MSRVLKFGIEIVSYSRSNAEGKYINSWVFYTKDDEFIQVNEGSGTGPVVMWIEETTRAEIQAVLDDEQAVEDLQVACDEAEAAGLVVGAAHPLDTKSG